MKNIIFKIIFFFVISIISFNLSFAQNDNQKKYQKLLKEKFTEKLGISDTLTDKFFEFYSKSRNDIKKLNKEKKETMETIEQNPESSDIGLKIDRLVEIDQLIENSKKDLINNLKTIFTPPQIAKTIIFQKNLQKFLRKEIKKKQNKND